jgi:hypothetical protein
MVEFTTIIMVMTRINHIGNAQIYKLKLRDDNYTAKVSIMKL